MAFLQETQSNTVQGSHVMVVGTGGIGCELLKNLVLTGFQNISAIDLDTIDVSNLNRQFLFQKKHVGRPKVEVAKETAQLFNPNATITAYHDSVLNSEYNVNFFKQFSLVMNALDNKAARNHVNRLCLAAGVTLIESGSAGYLGQVTVIRKGVSECYECQPKPAAKTYPGCTIRNTPSEPIHCIVWAKHLFNQLFGEPDTDNDVSPETEKEEGMESGEDDSHVQRISTRQWAENNDYNSKKLFHKLFKSDIEYLLSMEKLWQTRKPPTPLELGNLPGKNTSEGSTGGLADQRVWSISECAQVFQDCVVELKKEFTANGELVWDKDDKSRLDFVVAAANLRSYAYSIQQKSRFDVKSMAGNIIPAIATTNAVIAGIIVMEALKVLAGESHKCKTTYLPKYPNPYKKLLVACTPNPPNPKCYVCSPKPEATVKFNCNSVTVASLQDKIMKKHFGMVAPDVEIDDGKGTILLSSEEGETDDNLPKCVSEFGVSNGTRLKVDDFLQNMTLVITIVHTDTPLEDEKEFEQVNEDDVEGDTGAPMPISSRKRKASTDSEQQATKKARKDSNSIEI
ncbi:SUMO-activating enzyme subunit 2-like [Halichondria panicea]|uniref:SUMO-activating enzyme subunit 2-like n=1 Tax=Halichondria panicea TaxID=6063 RepID=UPI00312B8D38